MASKTNVLKLPGAMPVRTLAVDVTEGKDLGARWEGEEGTVGKANDNALVLTDSTVSGYHVRLAASSSGVRVTDLGSTNGVFAGDVRITEGVVPQGTALRLGGTSLVVRNGLPTTVEIHDEDRLGPLLGRSQTMRRLMTQVRRAAQGNIAVLLVGESGTGKELLARALHDASPRAQAPFVTIDCGSVTPTLMASELFGHEKGAFTGAIQTKKGAFEAAHSGTIFLDEIGELPAELQTNLLGVLERRRFCRVGGRTEIAVDVRVVAATNRDLRADVNGGDFRLDLYYRLAVVTLAVPPLRDRAQDIPLLAEHFAREEGVTGPLSAIIPDDTLAALLRYRWPGNVRELRNYVQRAIVMGEASVPEHAGDVAEAVSDVEGLRLGFASLLAKPYGEARAELLEQFEIHYVSELLRRSNANVAQAARDARMARSNLNELLRRHRIR